MALCNYDFFFFNDTATTEIYTLSLHDALPISDFGDGDQLVEARVQDRVWYEAVVPGRGVVFGRQLRCFDWECLRIAYEHLVRSEEHTSELQSQSNLVCRLLLEKKKSQGW